MIYKKLRLCLIDINFHCSEKKINNFFSRYPKVKSYLFTMSEFISYTRELHDFGYKFNDTFCSDILSFSDLKCENYRDYQNAYMFISKYKSYQDAFDMACEYDNVFVVKLLINIVEISNEVIISAYTNHYQEILDIIFQKYDNDLYGCNLELFKAVEMGDCNNVELLLSQSNNNSTSFKTNLIHKAIYCNRNDIIELILSDETVNINKETVYIAALFGRSEIIRTLIINKKTDLSDLKSAIAIADKYNHIETLLEITSALDIVIERSKAFMNTL